MTVMQCLNHVRLDVRLDRRIPYDDDLMMKIWDRPIPLCNDHNLWKFT